MNLKGRIPVEPLDDDRLTRIERNIVMGAAVAQPHRARWRGWSFAAATFACAAAALISWRVRGMTTTVDGAVAAEPAPIAIATHAEHQSLDVGDASIDVTNETAFVLTRPAGGVLLALAHGRVELQVAKRHGRPPLVVRAGDTDVIVVGTHFSVDAGDGHGDVDVRVTEGVVRVIRHQVEVRVAAGQEWHAANGVVAAIDAAVPAAGVGGGVGVAVAVAVADSGHGSNDATTIAPADVKIAVGSAPKILHGRTAAVPVVPPATTHAVTGSHPGSGTAPTPPTVAAAVAPANPQHALASDIRSADFGPSVNVAANPEQVAALMATGLKPTGNAASLALYSAAAIQARCSRCGGTDEALRTLDVYIRRFKSAPERPAALWLRAKLMCARTISEDCRQAAASYLREDPTGPAAVVAQRITNTE